MPGRKNNINFYSGSLLAGKNTHVKVPKGSARKIMRTSIRLRKGERGPLLVTRDLQKTNGRSKSPLKPREKKVLASGEGKEGRENRAWIDEMFADRNESQVGTLGIC